MSDLNCGGRPARVSGLFQSCPQPAVRAAPSLQVGQAANEVNDGYSIGQSFSSVSAGTYSTMENNFIMSENHRMRDKLKNIARCSRCQRAKGKNARRRHNKMSAEDLNNVHAIREFVRRKVFPHYTS